MKFEILKKDYRKLILIIVSVAVIISAAVFFVGTRAKYKYTAEYPHVITGTIHHKISDLEILAVNIQNEDGSYSSSNNVPSIGYMLNTSKSYCGLSNGNGTYTNENNKITYLKGEVTVSNITKKGTKCFLYFDKSPCDGIACNTILAQNEIDTSRSGGTFSNTYTASTIGKIFRGTDDDGKTYFFAGANPNNWVKFAGFYWRIIRINGDETIRLIYSGTSSTIPGTSFQIQQNIFNQYAGDNAYVGYMYGRTEQTGTNAYEVTHSNLGSSSIKSAIDSWYNNNLKSYESNIDLNAGFCGDRTLSSGNGTYADETQYIGHKRIVNKSQAVSFKCTTPSRDLYTVSSANKGNKALTHPIGLITADEVVYAGLVYSKRNSEFYLYTNETYWTMTPYYVTGGNAYVFGVNSLGGFFNGFVRDSFGVRPVINLKANTVMTGSGTATDPYVVG